MNLRLLTCALLTSLYVSHAAAQTAPVAAAQPAPVRDEFFWLGQMNKATAVINTDEGLLDKSMAPRIAVGDPPSVPALLPPLSEFSALIVTKVSRCVPPKTAAASSLGHCGKGQDRNAHKNRDNSRHGFRFHWLGNLTD